MTSVYYACKVPRCGKVASFTYMDRMLCSKHWHLIANAPAESIDESKLLADIGLERIDSEVRTLTGGRR